MANEIIGIDDGSFNASFSIQKKDKHQITCKKFSLTVYIIADNCDVSEDEIRLTTDLPTIGMLVRGAYCISVSPDEEATIVHPKTGVQTILWKVTCEFDSTFDVENNHPEDEDPTTWPTQVRWSGETEEEHFEHDAIDQVGGKFKPIQTEADEPIFATTPVIIPVLEITRYEARPFDVNKLLDYANHTNSVAFWGAPEGTALMMPMEVEDAEINKYPVVKVVYRIKFKVKRKPDNSLVTNTWKARLLHHGQKYRKAAGQPPEVFNVGGNPTTANLTAGGLLLPPGNPPEYLEFNRFKKTNFNTLSLGP